MTYEKKISICMMIKNEEKNLHRCFKSLKPILDSGIAELIVVDTGSEDNSIKIAKEYTNKVYEHTWRNNFSEMRNISISYAKGEWIWIMDADEEIENPEEMIKLFQGNLSNYNTINIRMKNYINNVKNGEEALYNISILIRGFRNSKDFKYTGSIHEQPNFIPPFLSSNIIFGHYGYIWEDAKFTKMKFERTAGILKRELENDPSNIYFQFQLAVSWSTIDVKESLTEIRKADKLIEQLSYKERAKYVYIYGVYAKIAYANKKYAEIIELCKKGLSITKDYIDLWYFLGLAYVAINDEENGLCAFLEFLKCKERFDKTALSKDPAFTFYCLDDNSMDSSMYNISVIYVNKKDYYKALEYLKKLKSYRLKSKMIVSICIEDKMQYLISDYLFEIEEKEDIKAEFINLLENNKFSEERKNDISRSIIEFYHRNSKEEDAYYLLNLVRIHLAEGMEGDESIIQKIMILDYDDLADYYADILFYVVKQNLEFEKVKRIWDIENLNRFLKYVTDHYKNIHEQIIPYLYKYESIEDIHGLRYWIVLARHTLLMERLDDKRYAELFTKYLGKGYNYLHKIYHPAVLKEDMGYDINNKEHKFFFYMEKANELKEVDVKGYVKYLRKALKTQPMKKGIEILLQNVKDENNNDVFSGNRKKELEEYKRIVKQNINILLDAKQIAEVKLIIDEYLKIIPDDLEMLALKSEVQSQLMSLSNIGISRN